MTNKESYIKSIVLNSRDISIQKSIWNALNISLVSHSANSITSQFDSTNIVMEEQKNMSKNGDV